VEIANETRGFKISGGAELRNTFIGRFRGLMLSPKKDVVLAGGKDSVMDSTIHMMWMLYPIDVIWVNEAMRVVDVKRGVPAFNPLKPSTWGMHGPNAPAKYVIEVAVGDIKDSAAGDIISFS